MRSITLCKVYLLRISLIVLQQKSKQKARKNHIRCDLFWMTWSAYVCCILLGFMVLTFYVVRQMQSTVVTVAHSIRYYCMIPSKPLSLLYLMLHPTLNLLSLPSSPSQLENGSLVLSPVRESDAGLYTCLAFNSEGTAQVTFQLDLSELGGIAVGSEWVGYTIISYVL